MKKIIIRWSNHRLARMLREGKFEKSSYEELDEYGIADILTHDKTNEKMLILTVRRHKER